MQSTLRVPSDYYRTVLESLTSTFKKATVKGYAAFGESEINGIEVHLGITDFGEIKKHNDGRKKRPIQITAFCFVSKSITDSQLLAQDLANDVAVIVDNNEFGQSGISGFPQKIETHEGLFKTGKKGYACWETEWWQTIYLGDKPEADPLISELYLAINPQNLADKNEYKKVEDEIINTGDYSV